MKNKNIIFSLLLIFIVAISLSVVSAADINNNGAISGSNANIENPVNEVIGDTTHEIVAGTSNQAIQDLIDKSTTKPGDTLLFKEGNYTNISLKIDKSFTIQGEGNVVLYGNPQKNNNIFLLTTDAYNTNNIVIKNIKFVLTNETNYNGRAISSDAMNYLTIENCSFINGSSGIYLSGSTNVLIKNCYFTGTTDESSIGGDETGTKCVNIGGGNNITIDNCIFDGPALDGVSIAKNARNIAVTNSKFYDNYYGIFYGGGLINVSSINNTFSKSKVISIGLVKAASTSNLINNKFILLNGTTAIKLEQGNTAHGYPTNIGNVHILNNKFSAADGEDPYSMYAVYVLSNGGPLKVNGVLEVKKSIIENGIELFTFFDKSWKNGSDIVVNVANETTTLIGDNSTLHYGDQFSVVLAEYLQETKNVYYVGMILPNQKVTFTIKDANGTIIDTINKITDCTGKAIILMNYVAGNYTVDVAFAGTDKIYKTAYYKASKKSFSVTIKNKESIISGSNVTLITKLNNKFSVVLKDETGKVLANRNVTFHVHGMTYTRVSDENGLAGLNINLNNGTYAIDVSYAGENGISASKESYTFNVQRGVTNFIFSDFNSNVKGSALKAKLVNSKGEAISNEAVCFEVYGKKYYRLTDANGYASLNINLSHGYHQIAITFDGTYQYIGSNGGTMILANW